MTLKCRFERHVRIQEDGCHIWIGGKNRDGYGHFKINGKTYKAHRVARYIYKGFNLNSKININHKNECNNSSCINPEHTYEGTQRNNMEDKSEMVIHRRLSVRNI